MLSGALRLPTLPETALDPPPLPTGVLPGELVPPPSYSKNRSSSSSTLSGLGAPKIAVLLICLTDSSDPESSDLS